MVRAMPQMTTDMYIAQKVRAGPKSTPSNAPLCNEVECVGQHVPGDTPSIFDNPWRGVWVDDGFGSHLGRCPKLHSLSEGLSVLVKFRLPTLLQLRLPLRRFRSLPDVHLYSLPSSQHLALQVETTASAGFVDVE